MDLNRSKWLDFSEKRLDKPRTGGYEFDSIQTVGKRLDKSKNGWINQKWLDMGLIRSKRSDDSEKRLDKLEMVGYEFDSIQMVRSN